MPTTNVQDGIDLRPRRLRAVQSVPGKTMLEVLCPRLSPKERERQLVRLYRAKPSFAVAVAAMALPRGVNPRRQDAIDHGDMVGGLALGRVPVLDDVLGFLKLRFRSEGVTQADETLPLSNDIWGHAGIEFAWEEGDIAYLVNSAITSLELLPSLHLILWEHLLDRVVVVVGALWYAVRALSPEVPEDSLPDWAAEVKLWVSGIEPGRQLRLPMD